jgi:hypothetical protein
MAMTLRLTDVEAIVTVLASFVRGARGLTSAGS